MKALAVVWALDRALAYAVATAVIALLLSMLVPDTDAERLATVAYLGAIFAAIILAVKWFVPAAPAQGLPKLALSSFPEVLGFAAGITILLTAAATFAPNAGAEVQLIAFSLVAVAVAAIGRAGAFARLRARLRNGGPLATTTRYASVVAISSLVLAALLPVEVTDFFAKLGYAAATLAALCFLASVLAPTPAGASIRKTYAAALETSGEAVFQPAIRYAALTLAVAFAIAALLPRWLAEPFAVLGYAAAVVATLCVGAECRRVLHKRSVTAP